MRRSKKNLRRYIREVANYLGLNTWAFHVMVIDLKGPRAQVSVLYQQREAWIQVDKRWVDWPGSVLRETITHELIHCWTNTALLPCELVEKVVDEQVLSMLNTSVRQWLEEATDGLARAIAPSIPKFGQDCH